MDGRTPVTALRLAELIAGVEGLPRNAISAMLLSEDTKLQVRHVEVASLDCFMSNQNHRCNEDGRFSGVICTSTSEAYPVDPQNEMKLRSMQEVVVGFVLLAHVVHVSGDPVVALIGKNCRVREVVPVLLPAMLSHGRAPNRINSVK